MPTYDYTCQECSHRFSAFLPISQRDKATCPGCGSTRVKQRLTGFLYSRGAAEGAASGGGGCSKTSCAGCSGC